MQTTLELSAAPLSCLRLHPAGFAGSLLKIQLVVLVVPVVDLGDEPGADLLSCTVSLGAKAILVLRHAGAHALPINAGTHLPRMVLLYPAVRDELGDGTTFRILRVIEIEVRRNGRDHGIRITLHKRIVEMEGHRTRRRGGGLNLLLDEEHFRRLVQLSVTSIHQHCSGFESPIQIGDGGVDDRVEQRIARGDEQRFGHSLRVDAGDLEGRALIILSDRRPSVAAPGQIDHPLRNPGDFVSSLFPAPDPSTQPF